MIQPWESNLRPPALPSSALPTELILPRQKKKRKRQKTNKHKQTKKEWFGDPQRLILNLHSFIRGRASLDNNTCVTHLICANLYHDAIFDFNNQKVSKSTGTGFLRNAHGQSIATRPTLTVTHKK